MRPWLRRIGTALLFLTIALCLAPSLIPPFLDRIYHEGPPTGHFDGQRFFNPGPAATTSHGGPARFLNRWVTGDNERARWPSSVPVRPSVPPRQVHGEDMLVTWIGHATVLVQSAGLNILTDPVWSRTVSPLPPIGPDRVRQPGVRFEDLPKIDVVLVSHNHYDHLDLPTLKRLWERDRPLIVTSLGNDRILSAEGIESKALDWGHAIGAASGAEVEVVRNHHWSSRWGSDRNRALWSAFVVRLPGGNLFFAGDTGWGDGGWVDEAATRGPFRLAIIPIGAYEPRDVMKANHVDPDEAVAMFEGLDPAMAVGVHWGTFQLTFEGIDEPRRRLEEARRRRGIAPGRFIATEAGASFRVPTSAQPPPMQKAQSLLPSGSRK
jgi:L-ascorbate metabolism protein UlaG (beta-lactamase superfamily)